MVVGEEKATENVEMLLEGKLEEQKGCVVEDKVDDEEAKRSESQDKIVENKYNPVSHYWKDKECQPLVHPSDAISLGTTAYLLNSQCITLDRFDRNWDKLLWLRLDSLRVI